MNPNDVPCLGACTFLILFLLFCGEMKSYSGHLIAVVSRRCHKNHGSFQVQSCRSEAAACVILLFLFAQCRPKKVRFSQRQQARSRRGWTEPAGQDDSYLSFHHGRRRLCQISVIVCGACCPSSSLQAPRGAIKNDTHIIRRKQDWLRCGVTWLWAAGLFKFEPEALGLD